jgi:rhodanese-related sulfurtransferase
MKRFAFAAFILGLTLPGCTGSRYEGSNVPGIAPYESMKFLGHDTSVVFLDVRTPKEYGSETGHLNGAILIPIDSLESHVSELEPYKSKTIIAYCRSGVRSSRAQIILTQHGFHALSMIGGITRWNKELLPVIKEQP